MRNTTRLFLTLSALCAFGLTGCGGSNEPIVTPPVEPPPPSDTTPPTVTLKPAGEILGKTEKITLSFSEPMDTNAIVEGSLAKEAKLKWSKDKTTLTLTPEATDGEWTSGSNRTLTVKADDLAGNAADPLDASYLVKLVFEDFQTADVVIGQPNMTSGSAGNGDSGIDGAYQRAWVHDEKLYLPDNNNNRILGFNSVPVTNGAKADFVIGQANFTDTANGNSRTGISGPTGVSVHDGRLVVTEYHNNRISIYAPLPSQTENSAPGTIEAVVGQAEFTTREAGCAIDRLDNPSDSFVTPDGKLIVTDTYNNRVLIWNTLPTGRGASADLVLGQVAFDQCVADDSDHNGTSDVTDGPAANTMEFPAGTWSDGNKLVVLDSTNNRALIWSNFPTSTGQAADLVLGQPSFDTDAVNNRDNDNTADGPAANTLGFPLNGVTSNGEQLFIADTANNRVLIWNTWPAKNHQPADTVLGQADSELDTINNDDGDDGTEETTPTNRTLYTPTGLLLHGDRLIVADGDNHRYLIYTSK